MEAKLRAYTFKVQLKGRSRIWRRIAIRGDQTLHDLHQAIFDAFDRFDEHLYAFYFPRSGSRGPLSLETAAEYLHPDGIRDPEDETLHNAMLARINTLGLSRGQIFYYLFDFGDEWWHRLTVEQVEGEIDQGPYPRLTDQRGASPPQYLVEG